MRGASLTKHCITETMGLPTSQKAAVKQGEGKSSTAPVKDISVPEPAPGQILVKINWTGLCGSDKSLIYDEWATQGLRMTPDTHGIAGHEGAGEVVAVHDDVKDLWNVGDRAGVKWVASVCRKCEFCTNGTDELQCPKQLNSGFSIAGTFQEYCLTDARYATRLPEGVSDEEAGPILCGGVAVRPGQWIVLPGAGGGLGHLAVQYAKAMGMRIIAVDGGDDKGKLCKQLGAEHYIDFLSCKDVAAEVMKLTTFGAHGVIVFAATKEAYGSAPNFLRPGGTVVAVGLPKDETIIAGASPLTLVLKRLNIVGSVTGTLKEVEEALDFTARGLVRPILTKGTLEDVDRFLQLLDQGKLPGRAVLKIAA
ncbi:alcohol dehydrogenase [Aureobasidium pullulans]|uniref:alcohol dehydrogenase n=2 Tax=Aureobasidium pullulans TaxID=5580 RepID=A0A4S9AWH6_AURPU|nr:alcohol dehydrogenase [Aureobasidium pullulans]